MIFMHDIVTDIQISKTGDFLTLIHAVPFLFLLFRTKNITLRNHNELDCRILIPFFHLAISCHDLSRT